jgi:hypothetical protein
LISFHELIVSMNDIEITQLAADESNAIITPIIQVQTL